ncbi:MAG: hypothetical protein IKD37_02825 [Clostridia bacterium]|nr:hypothetical protein [Clostridia bacterium]
MRQFERFLRFTAALAAVCLTVGCPGCSFPAPALPPTPPTETAEPTPEASVTLPAPPRYAVNPDAPEVFSAEAERRAAERIDSAIHTAIRLMNTLDIEPIDVLTCDYAKRPKQRDQLSPESAVLYDRMLEAAESFSDYHFSERDYTGTDFFNTFVTALDALRVDRTDLFLYCDAHIQGSEYRSSYFMPGDSFNKPCDDREAIRAEKAYCDAVVARIIEMMPQGLSAGEMCWYFLLVLSAGVEYDYREDYPLYDYQAYGALCGGVAVCSGYAQAFYRLCREVGISCWFCRGTTVAGRHAWNRLDTASGLVYLDITWYDTDDLSTHYREGKEQYLFMNEEKFAYEGYIEENRQ